MRSRLLSILALVAAASLFPADASAQAVQYINPGSAADASGSPFSSAVMVGNTLYLSGVLGRGDTAEDAARNALNSIRSTLEQAGMTMDDLVNVQIFAADLADYAGFNTVYRTYFTRQFPARAFLGATLLANARFEVLGVAVRR
ncbi:MAG: RidA family protein [Gemmatimonadota bacterium]|nr:RidA family protein [Gemmatimonadota bacterium]MDH3421398.1 RidA family protein [Gemmatimonadota bacterium]